MAPVLECQGNDKSSFDYYSKIASWETRIRNQAAQCEYQDFADEFMRDQFIAGLTSDALRVKLIGKGHRHKITQAKVKLREVVEVAKIFEATTFANQLMKTASNTQQEQVKYTTKPPQSSQCFWFGGKHQQPRHKHCPAMGKKCRKRGMASTRAYVGLEHDDKLDSNNPILSLKAQKRTPSLRSVIQPHGLGENIFRICTLLNMERKQKS